MPIRTVRVLVRASSYLSPWAKWVSGLLEAGRRQNWALASRFPPGELDSGAWEEWQIGYGVLVLGEMDSSLAGDLRVPSRGRAGHSFKRGRHQLFCVCVGGQSTHL